MSNYELYAHWLKHGVYSGLYQNESLALQDLIAMDYFPDSFDRTKYKKYIKYRISNRCNGRFNELKNYINYHFDKLNIIKMSEADSSRFLFGIGEFKFKQNDFKQAIKAYTLALEANPKFALAIGRRGDALRALGRPQEALDSDLAAVGMLGAPLWVQINAIDALASKPEGIGKALDYLLFTARDLLFHDEWRLLNHRIIQKFYDKECCDILTLYVNHKRNQADAKLMACLSRVHNLIEMLDPLPAPLPNLQNGRIIILAHRDLPQCDYYRVVQRKNQLEAGGWSVKIYSQEEADECRSALNEASGIIFYRVPAHPKILHTIIYANALGVPTYYDIDDLIFDEQYYPDPFESFENQITVAEYAGLEFGVQLFKYAMQLCNYGFASTTGLAELVQTHVRSGNCKVLRNGLDHRNDQFIQRPHQSFSDSYITLFYGSGTKAHNKDFNDLIAPALCKVFDRYHNVRMVVIGYLQLDQQMGCYTNRIHKLEFDGDTTSYWEVLSGCDISISVLSKSKTTDLKSEIKWLEAAMCGIPSILSKTQTHSELFVTGQDAILCEDTNQWFLSLCKLIENPSLRSAIGEKAKAKAIKEYNISIGVRGLLESLPPPCQPTVNKGIDNKYYNNKDINNSFESRAYIENLGTHFAAKPRILIVNVFFPPQTIGGATRVVRDNVDYIIDAYTSEVDIAIAAIDYNVKIPYRIRIDSYRGCPVYRISAPNEIHQDWRAFNSEMEIPFGELLDRYKPDLIHFHCIQRLTASIVEAAISRSIRYIVTLHDAWWISDFQFLVDQDGYVKLPSLDILEDKVSYEHSSVKSIARRRQLGRLLHRADALLTVSNAFADLYRSVGYINTKVIPNGVSLKMLSIVKREYDSPRRVRLGHIGGRTVHKGAILIEIALRNSSFSNIEIIMVNNENQYGNVRKEVWGSTPVSLIEYIPQEKMHDFYSTIDVLMAPSIWPESFGLVTREATAAGLWVIASDRGAIGEDIVDDINGFRINVESIDNITSVLQKINSDPERFKAQPPNIVDSPRTMNDQGKEIFELYRKYIG